MADVVEKTMAKCDFVAHPASLADYIETNKQARSIALSMVPDLDSQI